MNPLDQNTQYMAISALRYQITRRTYGTGIVCQWFRDNWSELSVRTKVVAIEDIERAFPVASGDGGDDIDAKAFVSLLFWMRGHVAEDSRA
jgi:hypothetical protein